MLLAKAEPAELVESPAGDTALLDVDLFAGWMVLGLGHWHCPFVEENCAGTSSNEGGAAQLLAPRKAWLRRRYRGRTWSTGDPMSNRRRAACARVLLGGPRALVRTARGSLSNHCRTPGDRFREKHAKVVDLPD